MAKTATKKKKDKKRKKTDARIKRNKPVYASVKFDSNTITTRVPDTKNWDNGDTSTTWVIPDIFQLTEKDNYFAEPLLFTPEPNKIYFMVYAIWSSGDSFGHYEGANCECFGIYEEWKEAEKRKVDLETRNDSSVPWNGHFETLDVLSIKTIMYLPIEKN